jgi:energy-coupling factor transporter ATP-binding protein EcfA2
MLKIRNLAYSYPGSSEPVLTNVSLDVRKGELILIKGESGTGKSTLLFCINGLIPHVVEGTLSGDVEVDGVRPMDVTVGEMSKSVGTVFQNPDNQIFMLRVGEDVAFGCENLGLPSQQVSERVDAALRELDLTEMQDKETARLSGGQKQRLAIAGAYAMRPKVFLFDEPTTDLDEKGRREFYHVLGKLKQVGHTILIADHDGEDLPFSPDKVLLLEKHGHREDQDGEMPKPLDWIKSIPTCTFPNRGGRTLERQETTRQQVLKIKDVTYEVEDRSFALHDISLAVMRGEMVAVVGDNGSGKTTLFRVILGLSKPQRGSVSLLGYESPYPDFLLSKVGYLFQNPDEQMFGDTVEAELLLGRERRLPKTFMEPLLCYTGLVHHRSVHPHCLSRGERKKVAFLSILGPETKILLLDEPTTGLDEGNWTKLMDLAEILTGHGTTVIFSSHNMKTVRRYGRRIVTLEKGRIVADEKRG